MTQIPRFTAALLIACLPAAVLAEEATLQTVELAGGRLAFEAPEEWKSVKPKSRILERELAIPAPAGVEADAARLTMMSAGGGVGANIQRWIGQFQGATKEDAKVEKITVGGMTATLLDIKGTFLKSRGGPFGPKTPTPGYRMLAAIVETGETGNYFFKFIGPEATVDPASEGFREMVESLKKK